MRTRLLIGLTVTTSLTAPAAAETWHEVATSDALIAYADVDSIQSSGSNLSMTVFQGFELGVGEKGDVYYTKSQIELDCTGRQVRELRMDVFGVDRTMLAPMPLNTSWQPITDGTLAATYSSVACNGERGSSTYTDPFVAADDYWDYMYYYGF